MKVRIISAIIAIAIGLPFVIFGGTLFEIGVSILAIASFIEVLNLKKSHGIIPKLPTIISLILLLLFILSDMIIYEINSVRVLLLLLGLIVPIIFYDNERYTFKDALFLIGIVLFLGNAFSAMNMVRQGSLEIFFYLVFIPVFTDTMALIFGIKFGKHKMAPKISPKKSWEGAVAGLIFGTLIPCIFYALAIKNFHFTIVIGTAILSMMGQIGDLIFSKIKRENGVKDFSNIMPGHGGVLDRLDSTLIIFMSYQLIYSILF